MNANPAGLSNGVYDGSVLFTPIEAGINQVAVPVTLIVGCSQGGCLLQPRIIAVVNGASFRPGGAPRAAISISGPNSRMVFIKHRHTHFPESWVPPR